MERLQVAIEKARAQREGQPQADTPAAAPATGSGGSAPQTTAGPTASSRTSPDLESLWAALKPIDTTRISLTTSQITTLRPGEASAPFDMLRTRMLHQAQTNNWKRIAVVSPHAGCGKTLTVANLAFSLGRQSDVRTMIIDFDLRRATLARTLGQNPSHTMGDILDGKVAFSAHGMRHGRNVAFGLNSGPVRNPSELLQSTRAREKLFEIEAEYQPDIMLFDVPPLRAADDSIGVLRLVDAAIIVVAAEETPMSQIDVAERQVAELTNVMGIVLNKCRIMDGEYGYDQYSA
ncbi:MAG: CpsD/CapB family tyrosine-protein kinase [Paracoccaceae bacterium]